jgi:hypothetical protein
MSKSVHRCRRFPAGDYDRSASMLLEISRDRIKTAG